MAAGPTAPLTAAEITTVARAAFGDGTAPLVLAVSGGVDSMALMHVCARAAGEHAATSLLVATVDHGLRAGSSDEARFVKAAAERLGLDHVILTWDGEKPATGIQAAARVARYRLLAGLCDARWPATAARIATAHTLDDQAETVVMRLARGSGVDGLAGIRPIEPCHFGPAGGAPITIVRPFLAMPKARLIATMITEGCTWREDPSNANDAFERVRVRRALAILDELGVGAEAIARSARRLDDVRAALSEATRRAIANPALVRFDPLGHADLALACWHGEHGPGVAVRLRMLALVIRTVGGLERPLSLRALETLAAALDRSCNSGAVPTAFATTIGRTRIDTRPTGVRFVREIGRGMPPPQPAPPATRLHWDNRFQIEILPGARAGLVVRALGREGLLALKALGVQVGGAVTDSLAAVPSFWLDGQLAAVPSLAAIVPLPTSAIAPVAFGRLIAIGEIRVEPAGPALGWAAADE